MPPTGAAVVKAGWTFHREVYSTAAHRCDIHSNYKDCSGLACAAYTLAGAGFGCLASRELQDSCIETVPLNLAPGIPGLIVTLGHQDGPHGHAGVTVGDGMHVLETPSAEGHFVGLSPFWRNHWDFAGKRKGVLYGAGTPITLPPAHERPVLHLGMPPGDLHIAQVETWLKAGGLYAGTVGIVFTAALDAAVRTFQRKMHLEVDGVVGPATWQAFDFLSSLHSKPAPPLPPANPHPQYPTIQLGAHGGVVKIGQAALNHKGANLHIDGTFGHATQIAVFHFQANMRALVGTFVVNGIIDAPTWYALLA